MFSKKEQFSGRTLREIASSIEMAMISSHTNIIVFYIRIDQNKYGNYELVLGADKDELMGLKEQLKMTLRPAINAERCQRTIDKKENIYTIYLSPQQVESLEKFMEAGKKAQAAP